MVDVFVHQLMPEDFVDAADDVAQAHSAAPSLDSDMMSNADSENPVGDVAAEAPEPAPQTMKDEEEEDGEFDNQGSLSSGPARYQVVSCGHELMRLETINEDDDSHGATLGGYTFTLMRLVRPAQHRGGEIGRGRCG